MPLYSGDIEGVSPIFFHGRGVCRALGAGDVPRGVQGSSKFHRRSMPSNFLLNNYFRSFKRCSPRRGGQRGDAPLTCGLDQIDEITAGVFEESSSDGAHAGGFAAEGDAEGF